MSIVTYSKTEIRRMIDSSFLQGKPIVFDFELLKFPFGFKRLDGQSIMLLQLMHPGRSEESLQTAPPYEVRKNIEDWCKENLIFFEYNGLRDQYTFYLGQESSEDLMRVHNKGSVE